MLSTGVSDADADAELARIDAEVATLYAEVEAPNPFTFTLTGRSSTLRLNIRNNGPQRAARRRASELAQAALPRR